MKTILIILLTSTISFAGVAITDDARVLLDGKDIGAVPDAMLNKVVTPSEVQTALVAKLTESAGKAKAFSNFLAKVKDAFNAGDFDACKAILNPEITKGEQTEKDRKLSELAKQAADIQAQIDALNAEAVKEEAAKAKPAKGK